MRVGRVLLVCLIVGGLFAAGYGLRVSILETDEDATAVLDMTAPTTAPEAGSPESPTADDPAAPNTTETETSGGDGVETEELPDTADSAPAESRAEDAGKANATGAENTETADNADPGAATTTDAGAADDPAPSGSTAGSAESKAAESNVAGSNAAESNVAESETPESKAPGTRASTSAAPETPGQGDDPAQAGDSEAATANTSRDPAAGTTPAEPSGPGREREPTGTAPTVDAAKSDATPVAPAEQTADRDAQPSSSAAEIGAADAAAEPATTDSDVRVPSAPAADAATKRDTPATRAEGASEPTPDDGDRPAAAAKSTASPSSSPSSSPSPSPSPTPTPAGSALGDTADAATGSDSRDTAAAATGASPDGTNAAPVADGDGSPTADPTTADAANRRDTAVETTTSASGPAEADERRVQTAKRTSGDGAGGDGSGGDAAGVEAAADESATGGTPSGDEAAATATEGDAPTGRPAFDVVRVEPGGAAVIAGRAGPDSTVTVLEDGKPIGTTDTNAAGEFVVLPGTKLSVGRSELTLKSTGPSGETQRSADAVVIATPPGDRGAISADADSRDGETEASGDPGAAPKPFALKVPREGSGGAQVMQQPRGHGGADDGRGPNLAFRVVQYTNRGGLVVSGTASEDWRVRVKLNDRRLGTTHAEPGDGRWSIIYRRDIPPGLYTLDARALDDEGDVVARARTPFASQPDVRGLDDERLVVVQPGGNLWTIARRTYGKGVQYTTIYDANQDQIADPDLIYPGQVFVLPEADRQATGR